MPQSQQVPVQCRLAGVWADVKSGPADFDFCAFELPRCDGCPNVSDPVNAVETIDDPMKSRVLSGWLHGDLHVPI
jgi:hypothetical protein